METDFYVLTYILLTSKLQQWTGGIADITTVVQWICFSNN